MLRSSRLGSIQAVHYLFNAIEMYHNAVNQHTDGEVVIMLAFQASGTGSIPVRCIFFVQPFRVSSHD